MKFAINYLTIGFELNIILHYNLILYFFQIPAKVSKVEHQRLLKNVDVDEFLCVVHGQK